MKDGTPEPRTPVMIMVEASWQDQSGTVQKVRARIENKSPGGACVRLNEKLGVGTSLLLEGQWDKFSGDVRYCRKDGRDYLVGIQRHRADRLIGTGSPKTADLTPSCSDAMVTASPKVSDSPGTPASSAKSHSAPIRSNVARTETVAPPDSGREIRNGERQSNESAHELEGFLQNEQQIRQPSAGQEGSKERKHMRRKWFDIGHKEEEQPVTGVENSKSQGTRAPSPDSSAEMAPGELEDEATPNAQVELLSMEDIYRMAGILNPRKGYSINKIVEMLHSEHLRGLSKELKRASVLMALDAAEISVEEVLQDAKTRQDAIDSYEADQRRQFEAQLARKAEENVQIQSELERIQARYTERLRRNLDGMAREKATFGNWLTLKQQESQSMAEAVDLCLKASSPESPRTAMEEVTLAGARVKPV